MAEGCDGAVHRSLGGWVAACSCGWTLLGLRSQQEAYRRLGKHLNTGPGASDGA